MRSPNRKRLIMNARTWNLKLMATNEHPETTIEHVSQEDAVKILRGLMYGDYAPARAAAVAVDRHEGRLAA